MERGSDMEEIVDILQDAVFCGLDRVLFVQRYKVEDKPAQVFVIFVPSKDEGIFVRHRNEVVKGMIPDKETLVHVDIGIRQASFGGCFIYFEMLIKYE